MASEAIGAVLSQVWSALEPIGNPCALMGGLALAVWNYPRATRDIDLLISADSSSFQHVVDRLRAMGCRQKTSVSVVKVGTLSLAQFLYTPPGEFYDVQFDLWLVESELQKSAIARRVPRNLPGIDQPIHVLNVEDLILFKLVAGRMIDRADAAMLLRENRDVIDFNYLRSWVSKLNLSPDFATIWSEAFPDEAN